MSKRRRKKGRGRWKKRRRRKTFTLEHRPGQTRLILSGLLGNQQGAWSNLLNSASRLLYISLFLFLCLSRSLTFGLHAAFPICRYLSHPLRCLSPTPPLLSSLFLCSPLCVCVWLYLLLSLLPILPPPKTSDSVSSQACAAVPPPYLSHWAVSTALRQARPSVTYQAHNTCTHVNTHTRTHKQITI